MENNDSAHARAESPQELARRLDISFSDYFLLSQALTHRSYLNEHPDALMDNERLEFLGDAVLDFIVSTWLYHNYPEMLEGDLTRMRSALVHTEQLAEFARQIRLGDAMLLGRGEARGGGRDRSALLCDTFEALVGAYYLDAGIEKAWEFASPLLEKTAEKILANHTMEDPKSVFQEWAQAQGYSAPTYTTCGSTGPDHFKSFEVEVLVDGKVYGRGMGRSKHVATKSAARDALQGLDLLD